jgi:AcrR family transcriptional regulator
MPTKRPDRRVAQTRERIIEAFRTLMMDRGYERMTVQHVLDRSGVGRATFYAHFKGKEDLLSSSIKHLQAQLRVARAQEAHRNRQTAEPLAFSLVFLQHIDSHRRVYQQIVGKPSEVTIERHMREMLADLAREDLIGRSGTSGDSKALEVSVQLISGALWSLVAWWFATRERITAADLNAQFRKFVFHGLNSKH